MGMFDTISVDSKFIGAVDIDELQTKSLGCNLDHYEIRRDGTLWREAYDIEDRSNPEAEGLERFKGMETRVNNRWTCCQNFRGEIVFYGSNRGQSRWHEWSALLDDGKLLSIKQIQPEPTTKGAK